MCAAEGIDAGFAQGGTAHGRPRAGPGRRGPGRMPRTARAWGDGTVWLEAGRGPASGWRPRARRRHLQPALRPGPARDASPTGSPRPCGGGAASSSRAPGRRRRAGRVALADGRTVAAGHVIRATEAYTARLPRLRRRVAPVYSLMVATEPLPAAQWARIGLDRARGVLRPRPRRRLRPADGRRPDRLRRARGALPLGVGGRPGVRPPTSGCSRSCATRSARPASRSWTTSRSPTPGAVRSASPATGTPRSATTPTARVGWAGGYVGDGVAATNLAGRTLADLVSGRHTGLTAPALGAAPLPAVGARAAAVARRQRRPAARRLRRPRGAARPGRPARLGRVLDRLTGH